MNPKEKYHSKSIFSYINETPARQKHSLQNANIAVIRRSIFPFSEKHQPTKRPESKLHTGNASQGIRTAAKQQAERPPSRLSRTIPRPTMNKSTTRLTIPSVEPLNSIDITTNSLRVTFGTTERTTSQHQPTMAYHQCCERRPRGTKCTTNVGKIERQSNTEPPQTARQYHRVRERSVRRPRERF